MLRYTRCNIVILTAAAAWLMFSFGSCMECGFDSYAVIFKCPQRKFSELKDNTSHAVAAIRITMLHRVYLNMVRARLFNNCPNTLRNIHTNARENITRTRANRYAGYFFVAHFVYNASYNYATLYSEKELQHSIEMPKLTVCNKYN